MDLMDFLSSNFGWKFGFADIGGEELSIETHPVSAEAIEPEKKR